MTSLSISSTFNCNYLITELNSWKLTFLSMNSIAASSFFSRSITSFRDAFLWINLEISSCEILLLRALWISVKLAFLLNKLNISFSCERVWTLISSLYSRNLLKMSYWQASNALYTSVRSVFYSKIFI